MSRIAVDFDGTITKENVAFWDGEEPEPDWEMIEWVNARYFGGNTIIIWTARHEAHRPKTERWLDEWGVRRHALVMDKLSADVMVDDKAIQPDEATSLDRVDSTWGEMEGDD